MSSEERDSATGEEQALSQPTCSACHAEVGKAKFCPECGAPTAPPRPTCGACGHEPEGTPKFCPECGAEIPATG
ncbi:MAG: hypothetical protein WCD76_12835 [Pyrinomonadaceae bacterium]